MTDFLLAGDPDSQRLVGRVSGTQAVLVSVEYASVGLNGQLRERIVAAVELERLAEWVKETSDAL